MQKDYHFTGVQVFSACLDTMKAIGSKYEPAYCPRNVNTDRIFPGK